MPWCPRVTSSSLLSTKPGSKCADGESSCAVLGCVLRQISSYYYSKGSPIGSLSLSLQLRVQKMSPLLPSLPTTCILGTSITPFSDQHPVPHTESDHLLASISPWSSYHYIHLQKLWCFFKWNQGCFKHVRKSSLHSCSFIRKCESRDGSLFPIWMWNPHLPGLCLPSVLQQSTV